jgi:hypothetical protein
VRQTSPRTRSIKRTFDKEGTGILQRELFEGRGAGEDEMRNGIENFASPSELDVQFGIPKRKFGELKHERSVHRSHGSQHQFPGKARKVGGFLLLLRDHGEVIPKMQRFEAREVNEEHQ